MKFEDHCQKTKELIGVEMPEVHKYLDQYFPYFRSTSHWLILHHRKGVERIVRLFWDRYGYEGKILVRQATEQHIIDDIGFVAEEPCDLEKYNLILNIEDEELIEKFLNKEFG